MGKAIKRKDRLALKLTLKVPDLNLGASHNTSARKMKIYQNGELIDILESQESLTLQVKVRDVIIAKKVFAREDGDEIDFVQKYVVGQNFIDGTFNSGKVRRRYVSFETMNVLTLIQQQNFWK